MENISINTTQNITIEQKIASVGDRIVASIIDFGFMLVYYLVALILNAVFFNSTTFLVVMLSIPLLFYQLMSELFMEGQSWGKKIMKIKVIKIDGSEPDFVSYLIRWVFRLIDVLLFFGGIAAIVIIINGKGQRLGDMAANTAVIKLNDDAIDGTIYIKVPEQYKPVFAEAGKLTDADVNIAKEVLDFLEESDKSKEAKIMAERAKLAFEAKLNVNSSLNAADFLKALILDYNYIHSR